MGTIVFREGDRWAWSTLGGYGGGYATREEAIAVARLLGDAQVKVIDGDEPGPPKRQQHPAP